MKTFTQIVMQPTTRDGTLKSTLALTRLATADLDVSYYGEVSVQGENLELGALVAAALLPAYDNKSTETLGSLLALYRDGYVSAIQKDTAQALSDAKTKVKDRDRAKPFETAEEYLQGNLSIAKIDAVKVYTDIDSLLSSNPDIAALTDFLMNLREQILPTKVMDVYKRKVAEELSIKEQIAKLKALGYDNARVNPDGSITVS